MIVKKKKNQSEGKKKSLEKTINILKCNIPSHVNVNYIASILHKESKSLTYPLAPSFVVQFWVKQCNVFLLGTSSIVG